MPFRSNEVEATLRQRWRTYPGLVRLFTVMPVFDAVFNQVSNSYKLAIGSLSLLQVVRGGLVVLYLLLLATRLSTATRRMLLPLLSVAGGLLVLLLISCRDAVGYHNLTLAAVVSYFQIFYWLLTWAALTLVCRTGREARLILRGVAAGAVVTAVSVLLGVFFGGLNPYEVDNVTASTGWFNSPKNITAILVIGGVLCAYLIRRPVLAMAGSCVCAAACLTTYARAGAVALAATVAWLAVWSLALGAKGSRRWVAWFLVPLLLGGLGAVAVVGAAPIFARWADFSDSDKAGSGRASFWVIAFHAYEHGDGMERMLGNGYEGMGEILLRDYGDDIKHTHNDLLDMLMIGGVVALTWFVFHLGVAASLALGINPRRPEFAVGGAIMLTYACHGLFTGQVFSTDASTCYLVCLTCLRREVPVSRKTLLWERHQTVLQEAA